MLKCKDIEREKPDTHPLCPFCNDKVDVAEWLSGRVGAGQRIHGEAGELSCQFKYMKLGAVVNRGNTRREMGCVEYSFKMQGPENNYEVTTGSSLKSLLLVLQALQKGKTQKT